MRRSERRQKRNQEITGVNWKRQGFIGRKRQRTATKSKPSPKLKPQPKIEGREEGSNLAAKRLFGGGARDSPSPRPTPKTATTRRQNEPRPWHPFLQTDEHLQLNNGTRPEDRDTATKRGSTGQGAAPRPAPPLLRPDKPAEEEERSGGHGESGQRMRTRRRARG